MVSSETAPNSYLALDLPTTASIASFAGSSAFEGPAGALPIPQPRHEG
jgi:hypothetical protein